MHIAATMPFASALGTVRLVSLLSTGYLSYARLFVFAFLLYFFCAFFQSNHIIFSLKVTRWDRCLSCSCWFWVFRSSWIPQRLSPIAAQGSAVLEISDVWILDTIHADAFENVVVVSRLFSIKHFMIFVISFDKCFWQWSLTLMMIMTVNINWIRLSLSSDRV